jgi:hypothetical protein
MIEELYVISDGAGRLRLGSAQMQWTRTLMKSGVAADSTYCCKKGGGLKNVNCQFNDEFYSVDVSATFFNRFSTVGRHDGYVCRIKAIIKLVMNVFQTSPFSSWYLNEEDLDSEGKTVGRSHSISAE